MALDVEGRAVAPRLRLLQGLLGLGEFFDCSACEQLLELRTPEFQVCFRGVELGLCAIARLWGCEFLFQQIFGALELCAPEFDVAVGAGQVGTGLRDLFLPRTADQFVEPRLRLPDGGLCLAQARAGPRVVLAEDELSGRYPLTFRNEDLEDRFVYLCDKFDTIGCQLADNDIEIVRVVAGREQQDSEAGDGVVC